jgi:hypothetical protein
MIDVISKGTFIIKPCIAVSELGEPSKTGTDASARSVWQRPDVRLW